MGLNWHSIKFLAKARREGINFSDTIMLGRQELHTSPEKVNQIFSEYGIPNRLNKDEYSEKIKFCEPVFLALGASTIDSMDASEYENATVIADLNKPLGDGLKEKYDVVFDGGTLEHVFDIRQSFENIMALPRVGGRIIIHTMANNYLGHGFYQFSPELFYRVFCDENGYEVEQVIAHEEFEFASWFNVPDPTQTHERIELANNHIGIQLVIMARRTSVTVPFRTTPQQSDYSALWRERIQPGVYSRNVSSSIWDAPESRLRRYMQKLKQNLPFFVRAKHKVMWMFPAIPRMLYRHQDLKFKRRFFGLKRQPNKFQRMR